MLRSNANPFRRSVAAAQHQYQHQEQPVNLPADTPASNNNSPINEWPADNDEPRDASALADAFFGKCQCSAD